METLYDYSDIVCMREQARDGDVLRRAWVVGIVTMDQRRSGRYYDRFAAGTVYTIEFEDGTSVDVHEQDIETWTDSHVIG